MRKRNKKKSVDGFVFPVPFIAPVLLSVLAALVYVWLSHCQASLGREIAALQKENDELRTKFLTEEYKWTQEKQTRNIIAALDRHCLVMSWPRPRQVVHLTDTLPQEELVARVDPRQYAGSAFGPGVMHE